MPRASVHVFGAIRVLLADPSATGRARLRRTLKKMVDVHLAGVATTASGVVRIARRTWPEVIVLRSDLARDDLLRAASRIRTERPEIQIVAVTGDAPKVFLRKTRRRGVTFCVPEEFVEIRLPSLVRLAARDSLEAQERMETLRYRSSRSSRSGPRRPDRGPSGRRASRR